MNDFSIHNYLQTTPKKVGAHSPDCMQHFLFSDSNYMAEYPASIGSISKNLRTLVVEDNPAFRLQVEQSLERLARKYETASFSVGEDALAYLDEQKRQGATIDLALVDIGLPDMSGIDVIKAIRTRMPDALILVITVMQSEQTLLDAIRAGARGYILKSETEAAISQAISAVLEGNYPVSPSLARSLFRLAGAPAGSATGSDFQLSPREVEVLKMIARGLSYQEAASELGVSLSTVQTYIRGLYRKLHVHNRQTAVNKGREIGFI